MVSGNLVGRKGLPCIAFHPHNKTWQIVCVSILDKDSERMGKYYQVCFATPPSPS